MITIFTATYNRSDRIKSLYESLKDQTDKNFEWIIVDDESSDNTIDLIKNWEKNEKNFSIHVFSQEHGGKHRAINLGVKNASGEFFFIVDDDDRLTPNAIERVNVWISQIDESYAGVSGMISHTNNTIIGGNIKGNVPYVDATNFERGKYNLYGDKAEVYRTDLIRKFKFPEFDNEYFVTEDYCWMQIAAEGYKIRWYNEPICIAEYLEGGLTKTGANDFIGHKNNYKGYCAYVSLALRLKPVRDRLHILKEYVETSKKMNIKTTQLIHNINIGKMYFVFMFYIFILPGSAIKKMIKLLIGKSHEK